MNPEIRTLDGDEVITEPGFYNISLDRHHSQPCDGPSVTSGILRTMELATPADVWAFHQLNPDRWEKPETKALLLGRAMAAFIEGGQDLLREQFFVITDDDPSRPTANMIEEYDHKNLDNIEQFRALPPDLPRKPLMSDVHKWKAGELKGAKADACKIWNEIEQSGITYYKAADLEKLQTLAARVRFWKAHDDDPRPKISANDFNTLSNMGAVLAQDPGASVAMGGEPEITMAWKDERTDLWVLSRPDSISFDGTAVDYKKMNTKGSHFTYGLVDARISEHAYYMQMALAAEGLERLTGTWPPVVGIVAQWDRAPYHVILREIGDEDLRLGQFRNHRALRRFRECLDSGYWPGPGADTASYNMPDGLRERILSEMQTEGLAP